MGWLDLAPVLKTEKKGERDLRLYPKCDFLTLYHKMDEEKIGPYDSKMLRKKWKELLMNWYNINKWTRELARMRRKQGEEWSDIAKKRAHELVFKLLLEVKYVYSEYINLINMTLPIWQNIMINVFKSINLTKEEVYEIMPQPQVMNLKLLFRQIFEPVIRVLTDLEQKLVQGEVDVVRMREYEDMMLLTVLPFFERTYKEIVKRQKTGVW